VPPPRKRATSHVDVALPLPLFRTFTYRVDGPAPPAGTRVLVPFRRGERIGWVLGPGDPSGVRGIRPVLDVLDREPSVPPGLMGLARWMAAYYVTPLGVVLRSLVPSVLSDASRDHLTLTDAGRDVVEFPAASATAPRLTPRGRQLLEALARRGGTGTVAGLRRELGRGSPWDAVREVAALRLVEHEMEPPRAPTLRIRKVVRVLHPAPDLTRREELFGRAPRQRECLELLEGSEGARELSLLTGADGFSRSVVSGLEEKGLVELAEEELLRDPFQGREEPGPPPDLRATPAQERAIEALIAALDREGPSPFLLHGITGSGKTLVYIQLLQEVVVRRNRTAIVLVPEIALTPQTVSRFRAWFGERVAVLHSALSDGERYDEWRRLRAGEKRIVVGARSALFAPLPELGAIVVDEEHEGSYKQSEAPRYHARDLAVLRAHLEGAVCVLGSATPSLESWRNAERGKFTRLSLPERATGASLPAVELVDLRTLRKPDGGDRGPETVLSPRLVAAVRSRLERGEQAILLLNRRGYASFVQCRGCGEVMECPHCSVSLTFHRGRKRLLCHHCRHEEAAPRRCPRCGDPDLSYRGLGTEQVERIVFETFPSARIARMDVDTTGGKWAHAEILGRVERKEVDLLLGTQMIAKGLDFPNVTLVGVINADVGLHLPDFRASERTFQLLSQVAGRAGRGGLGGEVIVQTSVPHHYAIQAALAHDFQGFARRELEERSDPRYPPHLRLANVVVSSPDPELAAAGCEGAAGWVRQRLEGRGRGGSGGVELVGPAPSPIERLHGRWRWHFFLRSPSPAALGRILDLLVREHEPPAGDVRIAVDRDPVALL
jgi:primosomal protein N' (replication factor Y) (superfamily II helicase)